MGRRRAVWNAIATVATFVAVMLTVTAALESVIFFSLLVGIPAGIVAAVGVWSVLHLASRSRDRGSRT